MFRSIIATTLALVVTAPLSAQTATPPSAAPPVAAQKSIAKAEVMTNADAEFKRVDSNNDGQMSRTEIETFQRATATRMMATRSAAIFKALDVDNNGALSAVEFAKLGSGPPKIDAASVLRIDTSKDGQISRAEHRAATLDTFTQIDTNKDGVLTAAEAQATQSN